MALAMLAAGARLGATAGSAGADFLKIPVSTRSAGMGGALSALSDDLSALELNPARLSEMDGALLSAGHMAYFEGTSMEQVSLGYGWSRSGLALLYESFNSPEIEGLNALGGAAPSFALHDSALSLGFGMAFGPLSVGLGGKSVTRSLAGLNSSGFAGDAGLALAPAGMGFSLALSAQNLGSLSAMEATGDPMPSNYRLGLGFEGEPFSQGRLLVEADGVIEADSGPQFRAGAELGYKSAFFVRAGGQWAEAFDGRQSFSAGVGLRYHGVQLDYAYVPFSGLGTAHRASLSVWLSRLANPKALPKHALLSRPLNFSLKPTATGVELSWDAPEAGEPAGYAAYVRLGSDAELKRINPKPVSKRRLLVKGAFADKDYGFALAAIDAEGREGERSRELKYRSNGGAPGAELGLPEPPTGLKALRKGGMIFVRWQPSPSQGPLRYQVYLSSRQGTAYAPVKHGLVKDNELQFEPGPLKGSNAFVVVRALRVQPGATLESEFSEEASVSMK